MPSNSRQQPRFSSHGEVGGVGVGAAVGAGVGGATGICGAAVGSIHGTLTMQTASLQDLDARDAELIVLV